MANPPKDKATKIDNRSQLIYALTEVAELEHILRFSSHLRRGVRGGAAPLCGRREAKLQQADTVRCIPLNESGTVVFRLMAPSQYFHSAFPLPLIGE
jgi:hypothetical protein